MFNDTTRAAFYSSLWPSCKTNYSHNAKFQLVIRLISYRYEYQKLYDKTFVIYINLTDQAVFDFLIKHNLYECAFENIIQLIGLNKDVI